MNNSSIDISLGLLLISVRSWEDGTKVRVPDVSKYSSTKEKLLFIRRIQWEDERYVDCFIDTFSCISHPLWAMLGRSILCEYARWYHRKSIMFSIPL